MTKDATAIVLPAPFIPLPGLQVYVGSVKSDELLTLATQTGYSLDWTPAQAAQASWADWQQALQNQDCYAGKASFAAPRHSWHRHRRHVPIHS